MGNVTTTTYANQIYLELPYTEALDQVVAALKDEGFGVLSEIDMQETLKQKRNVDVGSYMILGACHPPFAERALKVDQNAGLLLPCNIVVRAEGEGSIVTILDPVTAISIANDPELAAIAEEARAKLDRVLAALG